MKFGGTSVADAAAFRRVAEVVWTRQELRPVVVVSAMSRVTDALLAACATAAAGDAERAERALAEHFARHRAVAEELLSTAETDAFAAELDAARAGLAEALRRAAGADETRTEAAATRAAPDAALQDEIVSYGERLSAALLAAVLRGRDLKARALDARRCVITDEEFGRATPLADETAHCTRAHIGAALDAEELPVLGGFIAATRAGVTTTLGRGGSDYTAALVGAALEAREIQIWTDVPGVLTADPRVVAAATTIPRLSFAEAAELAYFGAKVLHPKTILPAIVRGIPVRICDSRDAGAPDTVIFFDAEQSPRTVKAIAHKRGVTVVHVTSARMLGAYGFLRTLFEVFARHRTAVDLVTTSEVSVSLSLDDTGALAEIVTELEEIAAVKVEHDLAVVCVVGEGLRNTPGVAARVFTAVRNINVMLISQGASSVNLTFVVAEETVEQVVRQLHQAFFERDTRELYHTAMLEH
jgi:aspartate kinase